MINENKFLKTLTAALAAISIVCAFAGCSSDEKADSPKKADSSASSEKSADSKEDTSSNNPSDAVAASSAQPADGAVLNAAPASEDTKYGDAEIYTNDNGNPAAKTEDGTEVELTTESINELFKEYEKVKDTDSEEEAAILEQLQLFLEASPNVSEAPAE